MNKQVFEYVKQAALKAGYEDEVEKMAAIGSVIKAYGHIMPNAKMFPKKPPKLNAPLLSQTPIRIGNLDKLRNAYRTSPASPMPSPKITVPAPRFNPRMKYNGDRWSFLTKS